MKTIGLIATTSLGCARGYFDVINQTVNHALGGQHSAKIITYHADVQDIEQSLADGRWDKLSELVVTAAVMLEKADVDFLVLCSNALHKLIPDIKKAVRIPVLHVVDVVADELTESEIQTVGVLGTKYTTSLDFYKPILAARGITAIVPSEADMDLLDGAIFSELCFGTASDKSKRELLRVIDDLCERGAEGVVFACSLLNRLAEQIDTDVLLFDTTMIHAERAARLALADGASGAQYTNGAL
jgi:aspartate racemase